MHTWLAVFDCPDRPVGAADQLVPELVVDRLAWVPPTER
jgi:hypothetical protein